MTDKRFDTTPKRKVTTVRGHARTTKSGRLTWVREHLRRTIAPDGFRVSKDERPSRDELKEYDLDNAKYIMSVHNPVYGVTGVASTEQEYMHLYYDPESDVILEVNPYPDDIWGIRSLGSPDKIKGEHKSYYDYLRSEGDLDWLDDYYGDYDEEYYDDY